MIYKYMMQNIKCLIRFKIKDVTRNDMNYIIKFTLFFFCVELAFPFIATNRPFVRLKLESYTFFVPLMKFYVLFIYLGYLNSIIPSDYLIRLSN